MLSEVIYHMYVQPHAGSETCLRQFGLSLGQRWRRYAIDAM
jgi:hypothetical protein